MTGDRDDDLRKLQQCLATVDALARELARLREQLLALQRQAAARPLAGTQMPAPGAAVPPVTPSPAAGADAVMPRPAPQAGSPLPVSSLRSSRAVWPGADRRPPGKPALAEPAAHEAPGYEPVPARPGFLQKTPASLEQWVAVFDIDQLPILGRTALDIERCRADEDAVDLHALGELIRSDPLMSLKLFAHVSKARGLHEGSDPENVTGALVMLGVSRFFQTFGPQRSVEQLLSDWPQALQGFERVLGRCERAARFALAFAVQRMDHDATLIYSAALLHDFAELLVWFTAPHLALEMRHRQLARPGLRSADVQQMLLNLRLVELQRALSHHWHLPARLLAITDAYRNPNSLQVRTVQLAVRIARHSAAGWDDPAIPDDVTEIARLLNLTPEPTLKLLHGIDEG